MRLLVQNEAQSENIRKQMAEGRDGEGGLETLPNVCFKIEDCAAHRCEVHTTVPVLNTACYFDNMVECGACAYERGRREGRLWFRIKRFLTRGETWPYGCTTCGNSGQVLNLGPDGYQPLPHPAPLYLPCPDCRRARVRETARASELEGEDAT